MGDKVTRIAIVDDHQIVAEGFSRLVEDASGFEVDGVFASAEAFLSSLRTNPAPDVCVLDLSMPGMNGADLLRLLQEQRPSVRVLVVSAAARPEIAARCLREGALGFLSKFHSSESFLGALRMVADGRRYIDDDLFHDVIGLLAAHPTDETSVGDLSAREYAVMQKLAEGLSLKEIAAALNLSAQTVSTYRNRLMKKLNFKTNAELVKYSVAHDLSVSVDS